MPSAQLIVKVANGSNILLGPQDRVIKEITIECESGRCPSRHGQEKPVEFTFDDGGNFPEAGDDFLSLILPARSPSNTQDRPRCFCSAQCLKDYLVYQYIAPGPRQPVPQQVDCVPKANLPGIEVHVGDAESVRKTDNPNINEEGIDLSDIPETTDWSKAEVGKFYRPKPESLTPVTDSLPEPLTMLDIEPQVFPVAGTFVSDLPATAQADGDPGDEN